MEFPMRSHFFAVKRNWLKLPYDTGKIGNSYLIIGKLAILYTKNGYFYMIYLKLKMVKKAENYGSRCLHFSKVALSKEFLII